ncbi:ribonuclease III [Pseudanabaena sp. lw0831]|uniref:ribonuclease III domain-containing protein n=1 Tax=Pseudanabaena sp. lw0831 TaxID=1357935 RepID=UPI001915EAA3|nr:ribonuclease III domain-containing protein [Pseudanabaena sp. lw0831]GBO55406.1 ribonuclease III [Pseudanabaena sp. lw0831]
MNSENIVVVEKNLGYTFLNKELLIRALTRKAFAQEEKQQGRHCEDQEIYRVLGDAILKAILVELLIENGHNSRESITNKKIELEKRESLGNLFRAIGIASFIRFGLGEQKQNIAQQSSVLGETFEALIAAVYLDKKSYETTKSLISKLFSSQLT